jgi:hypothetical protein
MTKERDLLSRALEDWDFSDKVETLDPIFEEIRTYLSTPSDGAEEPVAWGYKDRWGDISDCISCQSAKDAGTKGDFTIPLYLHPPKPAEPARKPMTSEEMMKQYEIDKEYFGESVMRAFYNGIRFAEKHHGIGTD